MMVLYTCLYIRNHEDGVRGHVDRQRARATHPHCKLRKPKVVPEVLKEFRKCFEFENISPVRPEPKSLIET